MEKKGSVHTIVERCSSSSLAAAASWATTTMMNRMQSPKTEEQHCHDDAGKRSSGMIVVFFSLFFFSPLFACHCSRSEFPAAGNWDRARKCKLWRVFGSVDWLTVTVSAMGWRAIHCFSVELGNSGTVSAEFPFFAPENEGKIKLMDISVGNFSEWRTMWLDIRILVFRQAHLCVRGCGCSHQWPWLVLSHYRDFDSRRANRKCRALFLSKSTLICCGKRNRLVSNDCWMVYINRWREWLTYAYNLSLVYLFGCVHSEHCEHSEYPNAKFIEKTINISVHWRTVGHALLPK